MYYYVTRILDLDQSIQVYNFHTLLAVAVNRRQLLAIGRNVCWKWYDVVAFRFSVPGHLDISIYARAASAIIYKSVNLITVTKVPDSDSWLQIHVLSSDRIIIIPWKRVIPNAGCLSVESKWYRQL